MGNVAQALVLVAVGAADVKRLELRDLALGPPLALPQPFAIGSEQRAVDPVAAAQPDGVARLQLDLVV